MQKCDSCAGNSGILAIVLGVGAPPEWLQHDAKGYKVIGVPKGAVPQPLSKARKVVIVASVPQLGNAITAIEARRRLERVYYVHSSRRSPTATTTWRPKKSKEIYIK